MKAKKYRTLDAYKKAGSELRLMKSLKARLQVDIHPLLSAQDNERLRKAMEVVDSICSKAEDNMFADHPQLSNDYVEVFYGAVGTPARDALDAEMLRLAREVADDLFNGN